MNNAAHQEYDNDLIAVLEGVWGEGFLSPGGTDEVDRFLRGIELKGMKVLDIGCGVGGVGVHIASRGASFVTGIDIETDLIERCARLAEKRGVADATVFRCVEPGPLPFEDASFDVVASKDSIIHIPDKGALARDIYRALKPGGWFAASDWLAGYQGEPAPEMRAYVEAEGLDFGLASAAAYRVALESAGFEGVDLVDRNEWYRGTARQERARLAGVLYGELSEAVGQAFLDHQVEVWDKMVVVLDLGYLRPTHLRGRRPLAS